MDLSRADRHQGAEVYERDQVTARDRECIARILRSMPPGTDQSLALGAACPYDKFNTHKRTAWTREIWLQRGSVEEDK